MPLFKFPVGDCCCCNCCIPLEPSGSQSTSYTLSLFGLADADFYTQVPPQCGAPYCPNPFQGNQHLKFSTNFSGSYLLQSNESWTGAPPCDACPASTPGPLVTPAATWQAWAAWGAPGGPQTPEFCGADCGCTYPDTSACAQLYARLTLGLPACADYEGQELTAVWSLFVWFYNYFYRPGDPQNTECCCPVKIFTLPTPGFFFNGEAKFQAQPVLKGIARPVVPLPAAWVYSVDPRSSTFWNAGGAANCDGSLTASVVNCGPANLAVA